MSTEIRFSPEKPRSSVSYFGNSTDRQFTANLTGNSFIREMHLSNHLLVPYLHELWRIGHDEVIYEALKLDEYQLTMIARIKGDFANIMAYMSVRSGESLDNCRSFFRDVYSLEVKAIFEIPIEKSLPPQVEIEDNVEVFMRRLQDKRNRWQSLNN